MVKKVVKEIGGAEKEASAMLEKILNAENELVFSQNGTVYYVSENGDDSNDGLTPDTAIRNFHKVSDLPLKDGDSVLFERGGTYRTKDKVWVKTGVNYGAYGEGPKPRVLASLRDYADPAIWEKTEMANVWATKIPEAVDPAAVTTFNHDEYMGVEKFYSVENITEDGDFFYDKENKTYYLYLESGNPGDYFENIEIGTLAFAFRGDGGERVHIDNFEFGYQTMGAVCVGAINKMSVTNCVFGWQGGKFWNQKGDDYIRFGNAIQFWHIANDIIVKNNWTYQVFDAAMTFQGSGETQTLFTNIKFEYNLIEYCSMNIEYWAHESEKGEPPVIKDISIKGNILRFGGYGWGGLYRAYKENQALILGWYNLYEENFENFVLCDNIFDCADCNIIYTKDPSIQKGFYVYNNTYYQKKASGRQPYTDFSRHYDSPLNNQEEFEKAVAVFDEKPKCVKWLDNNSQK